MKNEGNDIKNLLKELLSEEEYKTLERALDYAKKGDD